jgi:hypothetical protein
LLKHKKNQGFSTFDFLTMSVSLAAIFAVVLPIIKKNLEIGNIDKAQREARNLAFELIHNDKYQQLRVGSYHVQEQSREIASTPENTQWEGESGKDPWGNPYHFRFLRNEKGMPVQIVVWSRGPEKALSEPMAKASLVNGVEELKLSPDDVVAQVPLR